MAVDIGPRIGIDGEREFRASIQQINQQIKTLSAEMRASTSAFDDSTSAQKKADTATKGLTAQIDAQKQKIALLTDGLKKSTEKYGEADLKTLKWRQAVADATATLNGMEGQLADTAKKLDGVGDELKNAGDDALSFGDVMRANLASSTIISGIKAMYDGVKKLGGALRDATLDTAASADAIDKNSQKIGISRVEYQQLAYAFDKYGTSVDVLKTGIKTLSTQAEKGSKAFQTLGIAQETVASSSPEQLFELTIKQLQGMEEGTERTTIATQLLGKSAVDLAAVLNATNEEYQALKNEAPLMADATITAGADMTDAMSRFRSATGELKTAVVTSVMPAITKSLDNVRKTLSRGDSRRAIESAGKSLGKLAGQAAEIAARVLPKLASAFATLADHAGDVATAAGGALVAFKGFGIVKGLTSSLKSTTSAFTALNKAIAANPIGVVTAGIGAFIGTVGLVLATSKNAVDRLSDDMREAIDSTNELTDAIDSEKMAYEASAASIIAQTERTKSLWRQLQNLADETGRVDQADRDHAKYILGELNTALGTEYEMVDGQISQYSKLRDTIADVIRQKEAEALISAGEAQYTKALASRGELLENVVKYEDEIAEKVQRRNELIAEYNAEYERLTQAGDSDAIEKARAKFYDAEGGIDDLGEEIGVLSQALEKANSGLSDASVIIDRHDRAMEAISSGNYTSAIALLTDEVAARWEAFDQQRKLSEQEREQLRRDIEYKQRVADEYRERYLNGEEGFTEALVEQADAQVADLKEILDQANIDANREGRGIPKNLGDGIEQSRSIAKGKAKSIMADVLATMASSKGQAHDLGREVAASFVAGMQSTLSGVDIAAYGGSSGTSGNSSYNTDIGGISMVVNTAATDVMGIAEIVSQRIYDQVVSAQNAR